MAETFTCTNDKIRLAVDITLRFLLLYCFNQYVITTDMHKVSAIRDCELFVGAYIIYTPLNSIVSY